MVHSAPGESDEPTSAAPTPKVAAAGLGGAAATIVVSLAARFGVDLPIEVAGAIVTVVAFASGYIKRARRIPRG